MSFSDPFSPTGMIELEKNADLALYLVDGLGRGRDPHEYIWRGERDIRTLQYTSHVVEALQRLKLPGLTEHLIEPAADWLLDLPFGPDVSYEEQRALRVYPSRFKTLALLGQFDPVRLREDFADLSRLFDPGGGWLPGEYALFAGMYDPAGGARLTAPEFPDGRVPLGEVTIP